MPYIVSTVSADVFLDDLGINIPHPSVEYDLEGQFTPEEIAKSLDLPAAISEGTLVLVKSEQFEVERPVEQGQILYSAESNAFTPRSPLVSNAGWLVNNDGKFLVVK